MRRSISVLPLFLAAFSLAQTPSDIKGNLEKGLTITVYQLDGQPSRMPVVAEGQTPNAYFISPTLNLTQIDSQEGKLTQNFVGRATGYLFPSKSGRTRFRLSSDDGAVLNLGSVELGQTGGDQGFVTESACNLEAGKAYTIDIPFFQKGGKFELKLEWMQPGEDKFTVVPNEQLRTSAGQTFVVAPGPKRWFLGKDPRRPGDGRPLDGVHPGFKLETFRPKTFTPAVGGMTFLPDGSLAVCTWDQVGAVYILKNLNGKPEDIEVTTFAEGLGEPLGIAYYKGDLYVTQKREVTRLRDIDKDGICDAYEVVSEGWAMSHNYHEFNFNLVVKNDKFYIATSVPLRGGWTYYSPGSQPAFPTPNGPGEILEIDPKSGKWSVFAAGLRTPNGMGLGPDGELFVSDNQGSWLPSSRINHVRRGGFYGHQLTPNGTQKSDPPAVWVPHNEIGNSPSEPILVDNGIYKGQMLYGDVTHGGVKRLFVEKVNGIYQGAIFRFSQGLEAGVNRLAWGPDGALYIGGIGSNGNWNHQNHRYGLQRLVPTNTTGFEMLKCEIVKGGFKVTFTKPVVDWSKLEVTRYRYEPKELYGGPKYDTERLQQKSVTWSADKTVATILLPEVKEGYVHHIRWDAKASNGEEMWSTETWYTVNRIK